VAKGEADIAIGTDTAGSGRIPAGLQGIVGIKPTAGVISTDGVVPASESYDCVTIFAPLLEPANRAMAVMAAGARGRAWPADVRLAAPPNPVVAVPSELPELDRDWHAAFDAAVDVLVDAGARIVTVDMEPFLAAAKLLYDGALVSERYAAVGQFIDADPDASINPTVRESSARRVTSQRIGWCAIVARSTSCGRSPWPGSTASTAKPAVTRVSDGAPGTALLGHRRQLSPAALGRFLAGLPAPMQLGKVEFDDGTWRTAFGCDASAATGADINAYGSWPAAIAAGAV
jgi:hypothetical protein